MKFVEDKSAWQQRITAYSDTYINIAEKTWHETFLISSKGITALPEIQHVDDINHQHLALIKTTHAEVLIIGTGQVQSLPPSDVYAGLINNGMGFELMRTDAACRTYNILLSESRSVAALLII